MFGWEEIMFSDYIIAMMNSEYELHIKIIDTKITDFVENN